MDENKSKSPWQNKVINPAQIAGIETSVLGNGSGRGVRIAWVNTGSGLRYKVVIDRGLDIADAFYNSYSLAWLSHAGITVPKAEAHQDWEWLYSFGGGLLTTCGLTHVGAPEKDEYGKRGLHGRISNLPAIVESIIQPNPMAGKLDMSITAIVKQSRVFGPNLELRRTLSSTVGRPTIKIRDVIVNRGNSPVPHMILYHCNFGWPLVDKGTEIIWRGKWETPGRDMDKEVFARDRDFYKCPDPLDSHRGSGESCAFVDIVSDSKGYCVAGLYNRRLSLALVMKFKKKQLPWLTNWQHWGPDEYVTALEPGTHPPIGQSKARQQKELIYLKPGRCKTYDLEITVFTDEKQINNFLKNSGR